MPEKKKKREMAYALLRGPTTIGLKITRTRGDTRIIKYVIPFTKQAEINNDGLASRNGNSACSDARAPSLS